MVICGATGCQYNKDTFCTKENTVIRLTNNGFPVCDIMAINNMIIPNHQYDRKQTKEIIIEEQNKN